MDAKLKKFINDICLTEGLSQSAKEDRTYAVLMYLIDTKKMSVEEATKIMDSVKYGESI